MAKKLAFLFLTYDNHKNESLWENFFNNIDKSLYNIYCHPKFKDNVKTSFLKNNIISKISKTEWANFGIVQAMVNLLEEANKDKDNYKFIFISDTCIPLYGFNHIYDFLTKDDNSYFYILSPNSLKFKHSKKKLYRTSQWCILNKEHCNIILNTSNKYKSIYLALKISENNKGAYDELYFYNVLRMEGNNKNIVRRMTTYVKWGDIINPFHPMEFNKVNSIILRDIINLKSLFGRKILKSQDILLKLQNESDNNKRLKMVNNIKVKENLLCTIFEYSDIDNKIEVLSKLKDNFDLLIILSNKFDLKYDSDKLKIFDYFFRYAAIFPTTLFNIFKLDIFNYKNYIFIQQDVEIKESSINELIKIHEKNNNFVTTISVPNMGLNIKYLPVFFIFSSEFINYVKLHNMNLKIDIEDVIPGFKHVLPSDKFQIIDKPILKLDRNYIKNYNYYKFKERKNKIMNK